MGKTDTGKTTLSFMGSGRYSDVFKVSSGRHTVVMKVSYYRDNTLCDFVSKLRHGDHEGARAVKNKDSIMVSAAFANVTNSSSTCPTRTTNIDIDVTFLGAKTSSRRSFSFKQRWGL